MTNASFKIIIRKDRPKKDGQYPVCLRVIIGRKPKLFPLIFTCDEKDFDPVNEIVKKTDLAHYQKNLLIQKALNRANKIRFDYALEDKFLTMSEFKRAYLNDNYGSKSFHKYIEYLIDKRENELAPQTIKFYRKQLSKLRKFRPELTFSEVNEDFIHAYTQYMKKELKNKEITWYKGLEFIKRICNRAYKERKISENPVRDLVIKRPKGNISHLTIDEVKTLETLFLGNTFRPNLQNVLRYFLFACYTGIRFGDLKNMRYNNLKQSGNTFYLDFIQQKSNKQIGIPLMPQALALVPEKLLDQQRLFKVTCNQDTNRKLKDIMETAEIPKKISFHSSRHTCSNVLLALNIPLEVRSMILGDTKEVVSGHYTKQNLSLVIYAMEQYSHALTDNKSIVKP